MFREMRRFKQQIPEAECIQILKEQPRGVLSMLGDDDYPYGIPMDHWHCEENGRLYFHCAKTGHKLDAACERLFFRWVSGSWKKAPRSSSLPPRKRNRQRNSCNPLNSTEKIKQRLKSPKGEFP